MRKQTSKIWRTVYPFAQDTLSVATAPLGIVPTGAPPQSRLSYNQRRRQVRPKELNGRRRYVAAVLEKLGELSRQSESIAHQQFLEICAAVAGPRRATDLAQICYTAGLVFRLRNRVYTTKTVIDDALRSRLPYGPQQVRTLLADAQAVLAPLEKRKAELDKVAYLGVRRMAHTGLMLLFFQLFFFMRLTFVELSWDVMEPVAYFANVFTGITAYGYFLKTYGVPKFAHVEKSLLQKRKEALYAKAGFKTELYDQLRKRVKLYESYVFAIEHGRCNESIS